MQGFDALSSMYNSVKRLFSPSVFLDDDKKMHIARLLSGVSTLAFIFSLVYGAVWVFVVPEYGWRLIYVIPALIASGIPLIFIRLGRVRAAGYFFLTVSWITITLVAITAGGTRAPFFGLYTLVVMFSAMLFDWRAALSYAALSLISGIAMTILAQAGFVPEPIATPLTAWLTQAAIMVFLAVNTYLIVRRSDRALVLAQQELAARKKVEESLRKSEERFRLISSVTSDYTFSSCLNAAGGLEHILLTGAFEAITGYTPEDYVAAGGWTAVLHPDDTVQDALDMAALGENKQVVTEVRFIKKGGEVRWARVYAYPVWDAQEQQLTGINGAVQDITERKLAEQALQESEERFRLISSITSDYTYASRFNKDGKLEIKALTGALENITGYTPEEFVALGTWQAVLHPDDVAQNDREMAGLLANRPAVAEARIIKKNGEIGWTRIYGYPIWDIENNRLVGVNGAVQDITERKLVEHALQESEKRYRVISEIISDYAYAFDILPDESYTCSWMTEDSYTRLTGYEWPEIGSTLGLYHPDDAEIARRDIEQTVRGQATSGEYRIITKSGETRWLHIERQLEWDESRQRPIRFYGAAQDITDRKQAEEALAKERKLLRAVIDHLPDNIFAKDIEGKFVLNNIESMRILGVDRQEDLLGKRDSDFFPNELSERWANVYERVIQSGEALLDIEEFQPWYEGKRRWIVGSIIPLHDERENVIGLVGINRDISEHKLSQEALQRSEAFQRALLDATPDVAFLISHNGRFLTLNKQMASSMDTTVEALIGQNVFELLPPALRKERQQRFEEVAITKEPIQWEDSRDEIWWFNSIYPVLSPSGSVEAYAVFGRNITEEKYLAAQLQRYATQLEQMVEERTTELRRAKEQIEIILNNTRDAVALAQPNGDIQTRNPAFIAMFGEQVSNWIEGLLWTVVGDEHSSSVGNALLNMMQTRQRQRIEAQIAIENGSERDIDLMFIPVQMVNEADQPGILVSAHDITHMKEVERFKTRFVADAVHDLATPITGLSTRLYLLKRSPEKLDMHMQALENQVAHFRDLLSDLRTLSQLDRQEVTLDLKACDVSQIITRVFDTYEPVALDKSQTLNLIAASNLPEMILDQRQSERVFLNLISNAINYTPNGKTITIQTAIEDTDMVFSVTDQGIGISAEDQPRVFERFYRTEKARQTQSGGTGLGLAIVKEIVELHGGRVTVESELGQGSTFTVRLPIKNNLA